MSDRETLQVGRAGGSEAKDRSYHLRRNVDEATGKEVLDISGVVRVQCRPYELYVVRAPMFTWDEIEPHIISLLVSAFGAKDWHVIDLTETSIEEMVSELVNSLVKPKDSQPAEEETKTA